MFGGRSETRKNLLDLLCIIPQFANPSAGELPSLRICEILQNGSNFMRAKISNKICSILKIISIEELRHLTKISESDSIQRLLTPNWCTKNKPNQIALASDSIDVVVPK